MARPDHWSRPVPVGDPPPDAAAAPSPARDWSGWDWLFVLAVFVAVFLAYQPAWHAGYIWDDDAHVTKPALRSLHGLWRIWFELGATQQYYPLLHSAFWIEQRIFGDPATGYHLVNIALHALNAVLLGRILRRLRLPWAYLAAGIFALHPVMVESVAWITELKNTMSGMFYFGAALVYLRFDEDRQKRWYALALGLFVLGLFSKTVTATLPGALLIVFWWRRGQLSWRRDVTPLLPLLAVGAAAGLLTAWVERNLIGAAGAPFAFTFVERGLIAGRVIVFYLGKLVWPAELIFIYPRWAVSQAAAWQYLFPAGVALVLAGLWALRRRSRGPLAGALYFIGTLFPVLGFFNVFPFLFSFVADHFQYLASIGVIVTAAAGWEWVRRWFGRPTAGVLGLGLLAVLGGLTWRQSRMYREAEPLYRTTIAKNPGSWLAHNNLGAVLAYTGRLEEAVGQYEEALRLNSGVSLLHNNYGFVLFRLGRVPEAIHQYEEALRLRPDDFEVRGRLGDALFQQDRAREAVICYEAALRLKPDDAVVQNNLGNALLKLGRVPEAFTHLQAAVHTDPAYASARTNLGNALMELGRTDEAFVQLREAVRLDANFPEARYNLGIALTGADRPEEGIEQLQKAVELKPGYAAAHYSLGVALSALHRLPEAISQFDAALRLKPDDTAAHNNLGSALLELGRIPEAVLHFEEALRLKPANANARYNLGSALLQLGRASEAIGQLQEALRLEPGFAEAHRALGLALLETGRTEEGLTHLRQLLRLRPDDFPTHYNLGNVLLDLGRRPEAVTEFEAALRLNPGSVPARQKLEQARQSLAP
jgi:tetratricopeptide (TPR) repeat protein